MERFWSKVEKTKSCWEWKNAKTTNGYGFFSINGKMAYAHRVAYELCKGKIPEELILDHLCRNKGCVNPDHLETVTLGENLRRADNQITTINSRKTHCPRGHELKVPNLIYYKTQRTCRRCHNITQLISYHKKNNKG